MEQFSAVSNLQVLNYRAIEGGRQLLESSSLNLRSEQGQQEQIAQGHVCFGLNIAKGGYCTRMDTGFLGNLLQCLISPQCLFSFKWNFVYFSLWPLPCFWRHCWEESVSTFFTPHHRVFIHIDEMPPQTTSMSWTGPSLLASSWIRYSWRWYHLINFMVLNRHTPACPGFSE